MNSQYVIGIEIDIAIEKKYGYEEETKYSNIVKGIQELERIGVQFHVITEKEHVTEKNLLGYISRRNVSKSLKKISQNILSIQFCDVERSHLDKLLACRKLGVDAMIESRWDTALFLAQHGIQVYFLDNACCIINDTSDSCPNIVVVKNVGDIKALLFKAPRSIDKTFAKVDKEKISSFTMEEKNEYFRLYQRHLQQQSFARERFSKSDRRFHILYYLLEFPIRLFYRIKAYGCENVPYQDGFIIASNHCNSSDQYWLGIALGNRPFVGYAAKEISGTLRGRLFSYTGLGIFIDRNDPEDKKFASEVMATYVAHNRTVLIFPEGTRKNKTAEGRELFQQRFKPGTVALAQKTGTGILPVAVNVFGHTAYVRFGSVLYVTPTDLIDEKNRELELMIADLSYENICRNMTDKKRIEELEMQKAKYRSYISEVNAKYNP